MSLPLVILIPLALISIPLIIYPQAFNKPRHRFNKPAHRFLERKLGEDFWELLSRFAGAAILFYVISTAVLPELSSVPFWMIAAVFIVTTARAGQLIGQRAVYTLPDAMAEEPPNLIGAPSSLPSVEEFDNGPIQFTRVGKISLQAFTIIDNQLYLVTSTIGEPILTVSSDEPGSVYRDTEQRYVDEVELDDESREEIGRLFYQEFAEFLEENTLEEYLEYMEERQIDPGYALTDFFDISYPSDSIELPDDLHLVDIEADMVYFHPTVHVAQTDNDANLSELTLFESFGKGARPVWTE